MYISSIIIASITTRTSTSFSISRMAIPGFRPDSILTGPFVIGSCYVLLVVEFYPECAVYIGDRRMGGGVVVLVCRGVCGYLPAYKASIVVMGVGSAG